MLHVGTVDMFIDKRTHTSILIGYVLSVDTTIQIQTALMFKNMGHCKLRPLDIHISLHQVTETPDHVKNYRPKVLVLTGYPGHRPALVDFANLITKKVSLLMCGHVLTDQSPVNLSIMKENVQMWMKDHNIRGFYMINQSR